MHVLVARLDSDGDVLLAGPAIRAVAAHADRVTLLCGPRGRQAAALLPGVDEVVVRRAEWIDPEPDRVVRADVDAYVERIARLRADAALVLTSHRQSPLPMALLLRLAGVPWIGAISEAYPGSLLDLRHAVDDDLHEVERDLSLAAAAGFGLPAADSGRLRVRAAPPPVELPPAYVVVHPGTSVPARAWGADRHRALVAELARERAVVVTGSPDERALTAHVAAGAQGSALDLGGCTSLGQLAGVLAGAQAVVVGNTGPAHLAAAVGTPVVSVFAPSSPPQRWRPYGVPHRLLHAGEAGIACLGCRPAACAQPGHPCLAGVAVGDVAAALAELAPIGEAALA